MKKTTAKRREFQQNNCVTFLNTNKLHRRSVRFSSEMKKRSEETHTLCTSCSKAEPKIFTPPQTPFPGSQNGQNLISWWRSPSPTNPVWRGSMHAILNYRGNRPTHPQTHKQTGPITTHCAAKLSAQCKYWSQGPRSVSHLGIFWLYARFGDGSPGFSWFGVLLVIVTTMDVLCAFKLTFSWRYWECVLVGRSKWVGPHLGGGWFHVLLWTQLSTALGDFVTLRLIRGCACACNGCEAR